ncbi:flavodoxin [Helicobacter ganmani]|uniref:flavodoxin n=1 Tax=Helicobacter ganmani TaxID=60246 RepID=UPI003A85B8B2
MFSRREFLKNLLVMCALPYFALGDSKNSTKCAIIYYTRTLNTQILSHFIQRALGADLFALETLKPYPKDYDAMVTLAAEEKRKGFCPPLLALPNIEQYDVILLGTPLWSLDISSPIRTFLAQSGLRGKILVPFVTNAGYKFGNALDSIAKLAPQATILNAFEHSFTLKEKTSQNLKVLNQDKITQNKEFELLQQNKVQTWLKSIKGI